MAKKVSTSAPEILVESDQRKLGRRLVLKFSSDPELERLEFKYKSESKSVWMERDGPDRDRSFAWSAVPQALSVLFLEYVCWMKGKKSGPFVFSGPGRRDFVKSAGYDRYKDSGICKRLFVENKAEGKIQHVHHVLKVSVRGKYTKPRAIRIMPAFLPVDCIEIHWAERGRLTELSDFQDLAARIRGPERAVPKRQDLSMDSARVAANPIDDNKYADAIRGRFGNIPLAINNASEGALDLAFFRIYVPQQVREAQNYAPRIPRNPNEPLQHIEHELHRQSVQLRSGMHSRLRSHRPGEDRNVIDVADDANITRMVILGPVGSGKSSLLQFLALRWAEANRAKRRALRIPLLIELRHYVQSRLRDDHVRDFIEFMDHGAGTFWRFPADELRKRLFAGAATVYFDGLDEILNGNLREEVVTSILRFGDEHPKVRIIVTSRLAGYQGDLLHRGGFQHFMLQDFDEEQIELFLDRWHRETKGRTRVSDAKKSQELFNRVMAESSTFRELASNPFLLTMMASLDLHPEASMLRVDLLDQCARMLVGHWKVEEALQAERDLVQEATALGIRERSAILQGLARYMADPRNSPFSCELTNIISEVDLVANVTKSINGIVASNPRGVARALIRHLRERSGILCLIGDDQYAFVHRAFQEFFCAADIREQFTNGAINEAELRSKYFERNDRNEAWREVLCLFCGMVESHLVAVLLTQLLDSASEGDIECHLFSAACLKEVKNRESVNSLLLRTKEKLLAFSRYQPPESEPFPDFAPGTPRGLQEDMKDMMRDQWQAADAKHSEAANGAVELLESLFPGEDQVGEHLQTLANTSGYGSVQRAALLALTRSWKNHSRYHEWLEMCASQSTSNEVRKTALELLARQLPRSPQTLEFLKQRTIIDQNSEVREAGIRAIAGGWKKDTKVFRWLKQQAAKSEHLDVARSAVECITRNHHNNIAILPWLKDLAGVNMREEIRAIAVNRIAKTSPKNASVFNWLKSLARFDKSPKVRAAAIEGIQVASAHPAAALPLFEKAFREDNDCAVRKASLTALVSYRKHDPQMLTLLKTSALSDPHAEVRATSIGFLAKYWKDEPEVMEIAKVCGRDNDSVVAITAASCFGLQWGPLVGRVYGPEEVVGPDTPI